MHRLSNYCQLRIRRFFSAVCDFKLKCGLEIHTQLNTEHKLFSLSKNDPFKSISNPNSCVSFFDAALPGTRPILNYECVLNALKLAISLNCDVNLNSHFDRKHYFYGDQPQGYQLTQHYSPIASNGFINLYSDLDNIDVPTKKINIIQLQLEQDTGISHYDNYEKTTMIDLNRCNVPLIELVTRPDFDSVPQVIAFLKKYQNLVRKINVSTGNLESGAIRVDVNVSVGDYPRVELKNLPNTSSVSNAIKYEYNRQLDIIKRGKAAELLNCQETRGWNGNKTIKLRSKDTIIDYRYMPDPELECIRLDSSIVEDIRKILPISTDDEIRSLLKEPYNLNIKIAKLLCMQNGKNEQYTNEELKTYYLNSVEIYKEKLPRSSEKDCRIIATWIFNELLGNLNKLDLPLKNIQELFSPKKFVEFIQLVEEDKISNASGKKLLFFILEHIKENRFKENINLQYLIGKLNIEIKTTVNEDKLIEQCKGIINNINDSKLIENIKSGKKKNSLNYLVGIAMKETRGRIKPTEYQRIFKRILMIE